MWGAGRAFNNHQGCALFLQDISRTSPPPEAKSLGDEVGLQGHRPLTLNLDVTSCRGPVALYPTPPCGQGRAGRAEGGCRDCPLVPNGQHNKGAWRGLSCLFPTLEGRLVIGGLQQQGALLGQEPSR